MENEDLAFKFIVFLLGLAGVVFLGGAHIIATSSYEFESSPRAQPLFVNEMENNYPTGIISALDSDYYRPSIVSKTLAEIKSDIKTPVDVIKFRDINFYYIEDETLHGEIEYVSSLEEFYQNEFRGDCEDFVIAIAGFLVDNGYIPLTLSLQKKATEEEKNKYSLNKTFNSEIIRHRIYVYRENGKYGSIGVSSGDDRENIFDTLDELVASFKNNSSPEYSYQIVSKNALRNLNQEFPNNAWLNGKGNLKK